MLSLSTIFVTRVSTRKWEYTFKICRNVKIGAVVGFKSCVFFLFGEVFSRFERDETSQSETWQGVLASRCGNNINASKYYPFSIQCVMCLGSRNTERHLYACMHAVGGRGAVLGGVRSVWESIYISSASEGQWTDVSVTTRFANGIRVRIFYVRINIYILVCRYIMWCNRLRNTWYTYIFGWNVFLAGGRDYKNRIYILVYCTGWEFVTYLGGKQRHESA